MVLKGDKRASLVAQRLKGLPAMQETWVRSLGWENPLERETATHSSILAWRIQWMEKPGGLQSTGSRRVGHDWATSLHLQSSHFTYHLKHGWGNEDNGDLLQKIPCMYCYTQCPRPCSRPPETPGHSQEWPRGAIPHPRSGVLPHVRGQGQQPRGANPTSKEQWLRGHRRAKRRYFTFKVRRGDLLQVRSSHKEIPYVQGKRNPSKMAGVAIGHQRADTLKP